MMNLYVPEDTQCVNTYDDPEARDPLDLALKGTKVGHAETTCSLISTSFTNGFFRDLDYNEDVHIVRI